MSEYCAEKIKDGNVSELICPSIQDSKCKTYLREKDLISLSLDKEIMSKYDAFSFSKAVDQMEDFGWCPQC